MSPKAKYGLLVFGLLAAFAAGRASSPEKVKIEKEIVEVEKKVEDKHKEIVKVEVVRPDGTKETTTKTVEDTTKTSDKSKDAKTSEERTAASSKLSVNALVGAPFNLSGGLTPVYGGHIHRALIGPLELGLWGMTNATAGISIGLTF